MSNASESIVQKAVEYFTRKNYRAARELYVQATNHYGYKYFQANIRVCDRFLADYVQSSVHTPPKLPTPTPSTKLPFLTGREPTMQAVMREDRKPIEYNKSEITSELLCGAENYLDIPLQQIVELVKNKFSDPAKQASELTRLAKFYVGTDNARAVYLAKKAYMLDPREYRKKWYGFLLFNLGNIKKSHEVLTKISVEYNLREEEKNKINYINGCARLLQFLPKIPDRSQTVEYNVNSKRVLYVASSSRPYHYNGYTSRTHGIVKGIIEHGWDVLCVTRPGYPDDRDDRTSGEATKFNVWEHKGVKYQALRGLHRRNTPLDEYLYHSAEVLAEKARDFQATIIHAASNYEVALPALLAARMLGINFVYEVRGLWEFTAASRTPGWETTERFYLDSMLETIVAKNADAVATLTAALANELIQRGVNKDNIIVVPNAIEPSEFTSRKKNFNLVGKYGINKDDFIVGYAGSIVSYEGLDDLMVAFSKLTSLYPNVKLLIVGDGNYLSKLIHQADNSKMKEKIIFTGRVKSELVPEYLSLMDIVALPRKPFKVCHLVSPLKPFEAMSMGIPLIVSNVAALKEISHNGKIAKVYKAGDPDALATSIQWCIENRIELSEMAEAAKKYVRYNHSWSFVARSISKIYESI